MKINGSVDTNNAADSYYQADMGLPQWNDSAKDHAMALGQATEALSESSSTDSEDDANDYPLAMDDMELGDFLSDAMGHMNHGASVAPSAYELASCDALHILEGLPDPPMNLPPP